MADSDLRIAEHPVLGTRNRGREVTFTYDGKPLTGAEEYGSLLVSRVLGKMVRYSEGNREDIDHFVKVHSYARTIGVLEGLSGEQLLTLEIASAVHDIACPVCRKKFGNTDGRHQEEESEALLRPFLEEFSLPADMLERVIFLVTHHHTYVHVDGPDYQILLEADYLVNCDESEKYRRAYVNFRENVFKTETGLRLLDDMFPELA